MTELQWKPLIDYEDTYLISNTGIVKSIDRYINNKLYKGKILKFKYIRGYSNVGLSRHGKVKTKQTHRLVMRTFNPVDNMEQLQVNHINGIKDDNRLENLEWCTPSENLKHAFRIGLINQDGERNPAAKLTENDVYYIRYISKESERKTAKKFNVSSSLIGMIRRNKIWKHV